MQPGGCAANSAIALRRLGVSVAVCGRVGDDPFGDFLESDLAARGIDTSLVGRAPGYPTSKTVIVPVVGDDRRFVHSFGANAAVTAADIDLTALVTAGVVYVGGYLVLPSLRADELAERFAHARRRGTTVVLDVVVPADQELSLDDVRELLPLVDYFVPNEDEARALTGEEEPDRQAELLLACGVGTVLIKRGERGVLVRGARDAFELPAPQVDVVEPSGAGDAFAAGLVLGILEGWDLQQKARFASVLGGSACTALGCWAGVFTRNEAEAYLREHPLPARAVRAPS